MNIKKRFLFVAVIVFVLGMTIAIAAPNIPSKPTTSIYVQDYANVLSPQTEERIQSIGTQLRQVTTAQVVVVTVPTIGSSSIEEYSTALFRSWGIGDKTKNNGVLILLAVNDRQSRIEVGYGLEGAIPDGVAKRLSQTHLIPNLKNNDFDKGALSLYSAIVSEAAKEYGALEKITTLEGKFRGERVDSVKIAHNPKEDVYDLSGQVTPAVKEKINLLNQKIKQEANARIVLVVLPEGNVKDVSNVAKRLYNEWKKSDESLARGALAVLSVTGQHVVSVGDMVNDSTQYWNQSKDKSVADALYEYYQGLLWSAAGAHKVKDKISPTKMISDFFGILLIILLFTIFSWFILWRALKIFNIEPYPYYGVFYLLLIALGLNERYDSFGKIDVKKDHYSGSDYNDRDYGDRDYDDRDYSSSSSDSDYGGGSSGGGGSSDRW